MDSMGGFMQERTLGAIAEHVGGRVCGDSHIRIRAAATLSRAGPGDISFLVNRKYEKQLESTKAGAVIVGQEMVADFGLRIGEGTRCESAIHNPPWL
jgi:UDP-3-O-[3-hydroxymyristoyl] glucosamine N-acyltransferase